MLSSFMSFCLFFFFFNDTATTEIYTLSLHDALPIADHHQLLGILHRQHLQQQAVDQRSEEHTSELQSPCNLVCRLLLEKKNKRDDAIEHQEDLGGDFGAPTVLDHDGLVRLDDDGGAAYVVAGRKLLSVEFFFFNATPTTKIYTLSLHDALPI